VVKAFLLLPNTILWGLGKLWKVCLSERRRLKKTPSGFIYGHSYPSYST